MDAPPPPPRRRLRDAFIVLFVAIQLAIPASYYVTRADDPRARFDERFAWRMYSPLRGVNCVARFASARSKRVDLSRILHPDWSEFLRIAAPDPVRAVADVLCDDPAHGAPVTLELTCTHVTGEQERVWDGTEDLCQ